MMFMSQVLSTDSGCKKVLGFIPRELAIYLSPLIERDCLSFEVLLFTTLQCTSL